MTTDGGATRLRGVTVVNRAVMNSGAAAVFDFLTDLQREPEWNDKLEAVEPLTDGPLRAGSRFRVRFAGPVGESVITYDRLDRPHGWSTRSEGRRLNVWLEARIVERDGGCEVTLETTLLPLGALRLLGPMVARTMSSAWDHHLATIKETLESGAGR
jgi:uncharacterized protein YndB with AHSA1/START domain